MSSVIKDLMGPLLAGQSLDAAQIEAAANELMEGTAPPPLVAAFLTALRMRGEGSAELAAFARVMRRHATPFRRPEGIVLDTCGTGGDHSGTFNISTAAALVAAGAGVHVAKHGNRSMTSQCGSADVLAALGVQVDCPVTLMERALEEAGICFLFAQQYHPAMKHVGPIRRELGFRTVFNLLGPLSNPAGASHQLIGVFSPDFVEPVALALGDLGSRRALVVHGADGLDELTTTGPSTVAEWRGSSVLTYTFNPASLGIPQAIPEHLKGGDAETNADIIRRILAGETGPAADIAILNAAAALYAAEKAASLAEGLDLARESAKSGAAARALETLVRITTLSTA